jgi:dTDP-4-dehydrorhamnose 3,5-epimerase
MRFEDTDLPGCFLVHGARSADGRGSFVKTFHFDAFASRGLRTDWREAYCSTSARGVVRGMHFQLPPAAHAKLVFCTAGRVLDVVLDLRRHSPTYGRHRAFDLDETSGIGVYIPTGCAHGFLSMSASSTMLYNVTSVHSPDDDAGISWDSFGFDWPVEQPVMSDRDRRHPPLASFETPFPFDAGAPAR